MGNLYQHTHTYANIQRDKCFCINFLPISYYDKLVETIHHNELEDDEFAVGNFTLSNARTISAPVIQEAFINMECTLKDVQDLSGADYGDDYRTGAAHFRGGKLCQGI